MTTYKTNTQDDQVNTVNRFLNAVERSAELLDDGLLDYKIMELTIMMHSLVKMAGRNGEAELDARSVHLEHLVAKGL
jgi:hypothetical protein